MKLVFCVFSYQKDLPLLVNCVRSVNRLKDLYPEHDIKLAVVNDLNDPISKEDMPVVDIVKETGWKRGFNLSDCENIFGQIEVYKNLMEETESSILIKIDSDTMMTRLDWVHNLIGSGSWGMWGTSCWGRYCSICGYFYAMDKETVDAVYDLTRDDKIASRIRSTVQGMVLEDRVYTQLVSIAHARGMINKGVGYVVLDSESFAKSLADGTDKVKHSNYGAEWRKGWFDQVEPYKDMIAVTFKRRGKTDDIIQEALEGMNAFWGVIKDLPRWDKKEDLNPEQA